MATENVWTIRAALEWTQGYLERKGDENPRISAEWLISKACDLTRIELYTNFERPLSSREREVLHDFVARRGQGEPLQYITGEVGFRHITVKVRPGVLIPRPETEVLVSEALALLPEREHPRSAEYDAKDAEDAADTQEADAVQPDKQTPATNVNVSRETFSDAEDAKDAEDAADTQEAIAVQPDKQTPATDTNVSRETFSDADDAESKPASEHEQDVASALEQAAELKSAPEPDLLVVDLCTGSGCIACSIAYEHPRTRIIATDIVPEATSLARENAQCLGLDDRVDVITCDLGEGVSAELIGAIDLVVANPPYVPTEKLADAPREVADFEPALALDGGADGLDAVRRIVPWCARALKPGGALALELFETTCDAAAALARQAGFDEVRIIHDLNDRPRVLVARMSA